ncbi:hypothetical protein ACQ4PT_023429 [Festuca glaucescens]
MDTETGEAGFQHSPGAPTSPVAPFVRSSSRLDAAHSFDGALRELKDLRYQLHQAADCCEKAFLGTEQKRLILDSTKSYICDAVVTVIDHLGTVSSKLEQQLEDKTEITQTERKISFLKQRLLTCEQYAISLNLLALRMDTGALQYHRRYLSQCICMTLSAFSHSRGHPVPGANRTLKPYDVESTIGREVAVAVPNVGNPASITRSFSFRAEDVHIAPADHKKKKASHRSNILSFLKRIHGGKMQQIEEGAAIVARYMASLRSQGFGSSHMRTQEDDEVHNEEIPFEGDEDDDDENYELEEDFDDEDIGEGSNAVSQGRKFISKSWQEFVPIHVDGEVTRGECKHCGTLISAKRGHGTSGLRNHLNICHARATVVGALNQMNATLMTPDGVSRLWKWDPDVARKMLVRMVVLHELPLSIVEYEGFRKFVSSLNPSFHMITRKTLKNDIMKAFDEHKKSLKDLFGASKSRISLTMDLWTSNQTIGYIVITSHFINDCWKLEKRIIKFNALETPHT